jgi:hypothetical protein
MSKCNIKNCKVHQEDGSVIIDNPEAMTHYLEFADAS